MFCGVRVENITANNLSDFLKKEQHEAGSKTINKIRSLRNRAFKNILISWNSKWTSEMAVKIT